jgi:hydroxymethylpyrimidine/phosphomethylpyrimidine kinase
MEEILGEEIPALSGGISNRSSMEKAAGIFREKYGCHVLLKGGHMKDTADDLLYTETAVWYPASRIDTLHTHGTGCTMSTAIACGLAQGQSLFTAVENAKKYVRGAMSSGLEMGQGNGPLHHGWQKEQEKKPL